MRDARSSAVSGPIRLYGGRTYARSTTPGRPFSSRNDTSASPTPSSVIAVSTSSSGFTRNVSAAARTYSRVATAARAIRIVVEKGGPRQTMEVNRAIPMARRLCAHPEVPDRRRPAAGRGGTRTREGQPAGTSARGQDRQYGHYNRGGGRDDARGKSSRASSGTRRSERPLGRGSA